MSLRANKLYRTPFRYDGISYIWDADNNMVADFRDENPGFIRVRGWGRISYMKDAEALHDEVIVLITDITKHHPSDPAKCVEALNREWNNVGP
jgi:hypothetical protein